MDDLLNLRVPGCRFLAARSRWGKRGWWIDGGRANAGIDFVFVLFGVLFDYTEAAFDGVVGRPGDSSIMADIPSTADGICHIV